MAGTLVERLADFSSDTDFSRLPPEVMDESPTDWRSERTAFLRAGRGKTARNRGRDRTGHARLRTTGSDEQPPLSSG